MKKAEWNEGLNHIDPDLVEEYIQQKEQLSQKHNRPKPLWLRVGAIAACFLLIVSAALVVPALQNKPIKLTGKQEIVYGESWPGDIINSSLICSSPPSFSLGTIVQAKVVEVLPDPYYQPTVTRRYHVARLAVEDVLHGEGLPEEIWLQFTNYDTDIFDGYETFIFSLDQVGIENYMLINDESREITYFPHMFKRDDVLAFNDGKIDTSFYDKADRYMKKHFEKMLADPAAYSYPVGPDTTLEEAKANILALIRERDADSANSSDETYRPYDYITPDDIFITDEGRQQYASLTPSKTDVFVQMITPSSDRVIASYTRIVNGFVTDEEITFNGYYAALYGHNAENGNVHLSDAIYTEEDLKNMPDLGGILENMDLSQLQPPHIEVVDEMEIVSSTANGIYHKAEDQVYGVIRVQWYYNRVHPDKRTTPVTDECFYLCDQQGNCSLVEKAQLEEFLDDRWFDDLFPFSLVTIWQ